jgi:cytochrome c556
MSMQLFLSGVILGLLVGMLLGSCLLHKPQRHEGRQQEIDRLVEQFQELFRQIDRDKEV